VRLVDLVQWSLFSSCEKCCDIVCCSDEIRNYFGETVSIYFAFLEFYTYFLMPPAVLGIISHLFASRLNEDWAVALFCVFNLVWSTVFLESWKRKTAEHAYKWGTIKMEQFEEPRAAFYGLSFSKDPVTRQLLPQYPSRRRLLKFYLVSGPVMAAALGIAFCIMLLYFWLDTIALDFTKDSVLPGFITTLIMLLPTVIYALFITVINAVYRPLAVFLNNWGKFVCTCEHACFRYIYDYNTSSCKQSLGSVGLPWW